MERAQCKPHLRHAKLMVLFGWLSVLGNTALADPDAEREALAHLIHEIEALEPLIRTAQSQANPDARIRFRYDWLRQDLARSVGGAGTHRCAARGTSQLCAPAR